MTKAKPEPVSKKYRGAKIRYMEHLNMVPIPTDKQRAERAAQIAAELTVESTPSSIPGWNKSTVTRIARWRNWEFLHVASEVRYPQPHIHVSFIHQTPTSGVYHTHSLEESIKSIAFTSLSREAEEAMPTAWKAKRDEIGALLDAA